MSIHGELTHVALEDSILDVELLWQKWARTPASQMPSGVKRRLFYELGIVTKRERHCAFFDWSKSKRRRVQTVARAAVEEEKMLLSLKGLCRDSCELGWVGALVGWMSK